MKALKLSLRVTHYKAKTTNDVGERLLALPPDATDSKTNSPLL
jgi:hypothetical protein